MTTDLDSLTLSYIARVEAFPHLSREMERELFAQWHEHADPIARCDLINANLRYAVSLACKYREYGLPIVDLICEGNLGILEALAKFERERGTRFVTYAAYWIRVYILNHIVRSWNHLGAEVRCSRVFFRIGRERARLLNLIGDESGLVRRRAHFEPACKTSSDIRAMLRKEVPGGRLEPSGLRATASGVQ